MAKTSHNDALAPKDPPTATMDPPTATTDLLVGWGKATYRTGKLVKNYLLLQQGWVNK
jgi:hypothetical protein